MRFRILVLLLLLAPVHGLNIELSVNKVFTGEARIFSYDDSFATKKFLVEFLNTGSLPYTSQARLDIFDESGAVFTAWSDKKAMAPGGTGTFLFYWFPENSGSYTARLRVYYSGETMEVEKNITVAAAEAGDAFNVAGARTLGSFLLLDVVGSADTKAVVMPADYPQGWMFTQDTVEMRKDRRSTALVRYVPSLWTEQDISVLVASVDGRYFSRERVKLERETGLDAIVHQILFSLTGL